MTRPSRNRIRAALTPAAIGALGIMLAFHATILSGFALVEGDLLDSRLVMYLLERSYLWLLRTPGQLQFWNASFYFPAPNVIAYSDTLLTVAPVYWLLRAAGLEPSTALQWWLIAMSTLNYVAAFALIRRATRVGPTAAALGAFLFAFANARASQLAHPQLQPQFYMVIAVYALVRVFEVDARRHRAATAKWLVVFAIALAAQLWAEFYYGFFLVLALGIATLCALAVPRLRSHLFAVGRENVAAVGACLVTGAVLVAPLASHYLAVAHALGVRPYGALVEFMPTPASWLYMGADNWMYGTVWRGGHFVLTMPQEQQLGLGLVTTGLVLWGLWGARRTALGILLMVTAGALMLCTTVFPGGHTAWPIIFDWMPGARALRAISRVGLILLVPAAIGIALFFEAALAARWRVAATLAALAFMFEQGQSVEVYSKAGARAERTRVEAMIAPSCGTVLYAPLHGRRMTWTYQVDGMWAGLDRHVPTINGYSGNAPAGWDFQQIRINDSTRARAVEHALAAWEARWGGALHHVCVVSPDLAHVHEPLAHPYGTDVVE
ncbi:MAG TPA: hypothetical protein VGR59_13980 [Gemmatimonadaceae bacterium]|nr:hypothetical protein [Gemmatimonadaceae bacterium]